MCKAHWMKQKTMRSKQNETKKMLKEASISRFTSSEHTQTHRDTHTRVNAVKHSVAKDDNRSFAYAYCLPSVVQPSIWRTHLFYIHFEKVYLWMSIFLLCWAWARARPCVSLCTLCKFCSHDDFTYFTQFHFNWCIEIALALPSKRKCAERDENKRKPKSERQWYSEWGRAKAWKIIVSPCMYPFFVEILPPPVTHSSEI